MTEPPLTDLEIKAMRALFHYCATPLNDGAVPLADRILTEACRAALQPPSEFWYCHCRGTRNRGPVQPLDIDGVVHDKYGCRPTVPIQPPGPAPSVAPAETQPRSTDRDRVIAERRHSHPPGAPCTDDCVWKEPVTTDAQAPAPAEDQDAAREKAMGVARQHHYEICRRCTTTHIAAAWDAGAAWQRGRKE